MSNSRKFRRNTNEGDGEKKAKSTRKKQVSPKKRQQSQFGGRIIPKRIATEYV
jgi:hypothetical protein